MSAGAIRVTGGAAVLVEDSAFDGNLGPTGGAITLDGASSIIIQVPIASDTLPYNPYLLIQAPFASVTQPAYVECTLSNLWGVRWDKMTRNLQRPLRHSPIEHSFASVCYGGGFPSVSSSPVQGSSVDGFPAVDALPAISTELCSPATT